METRQLALAVMLAVAALVGVAGCGGEKHDDAKEINSVYAAFTTAIKAKNGEAACPLLTADGEKAFTDDQNKPLFPGDTTGTDTCVSIFEDGRYSGTHLESLKVSGDTATARTVGGQAAEGPIEFEKIGGDWKISKYGPFESEE